MQQSYSSVYKSVLRATNDLIKDIQATMPDQGFLMWSWEDRMDEDKMPRVPLLGLNGFSFHENGTLWVIRFGITVSTIDDANLLVEAEVIDMIHERFGEKKKILLRDPSDGSTLSELVSVDFDVLPMGQTQVRNYRTIGVELKRTGT